MSSDNHHYWCETIKLNVAHSMTPDFQCFGRIQLNCSRFSLKSKFIRRTRTTNVFLFPCCKRWKSVSFANVTRNICFHSKLCKFSEQREPKDHFPICCFFFGLKNCSIADVALFHWGRLLCSMHALKVHVGPYSTKNDRIISSKASGREKKSAHLMLIACVQCTF